MMTDTAFANFRLLLLLRQRRRNTHGGVLDLLPHVCPRSLFSVGTVVRESSIRGKCQSIDYQMDDGIQSIL